MSLNAANVKTDFNEIQISHCETPGCVCELKLLPSGEPFNFLFKELFQVKGTECGEATVFAFGKLIKFLKDLDGLTDEQGKKRDELLDKINKYLDKTKENLEKISD